MLARHISRLVPEAASAEVEMLLNAALLGNQVDPLDTRWLHADGVEIDVALTVSAIRDSGARPVGFSAIARDVTTRKRAEVELREVLEAERRQERLQSATSGIRLALLSEDSIGHVLDPTIREIRTTIFELESSAG